MIYNNFQKKYYNNKNNIVIYNWFKETIKNMTYIYAAWLFLFLAKQMQYFRYSLWTVVWVKVAVHWLRVGAIIAEFNMGGYQYPLTADALSQRATT